MLWTLGHKLKKYLDEKEIDFKIEYSYIEKNNWTEEL